MTSREETSGGGHEWRVRLLLVVASVGLVVGALEFALRAVPALLPKGVYGSGRFDAELGMTLPASVVYYNKVRFVKREPNSRGYMDVEHEVEKPLGTLRVGFFGDSYVEAIQVPLEQAFFRRLPEVLGTRPLETFGFGVSGWGTVHAYLADRREAGHYDLDARVYVFVENDLGDSLYSVSGHRGRSPMPFAEVQTEPPGYRLRYRSGPGTQPLWLDVTKAVQSKSLVFQVAFQRYRLLRDAGVRTRPRKADSEMAVRATRVERLDPNALPSTWPPASRREAEAVGRAVLTDWRETSASDDRELLVLYVPRGHSQLSGELPLSDTWRPWLGETCRQLGLPLLDPSEALAAELAAGRPVFDDHFSPLGHGVVAAELGRFLRKRLRDR